MKKNSMKAMIITLATIGIISAILLTFVYEWTTPYIQEHQARAQEEAIYNVLIGAEEIEEVEREGSTFFEGYDSSGNFVGVAYLTSGAGFQGPIEIMIGADIDSEKLLGISILTHEETPGLGARITEAEFQSYFEEKPFGEYNVIKGEATGEMEVQAIAGATISSVNVARIIENALTVINDVYGGGN